MMTKGMFRRALFCLLSPFACLVWFKDFSLSLQTTSFTLPPPRKPVSHMSSTTKFFVSQNTGRFFRQNHPNVLLIHFGIKGDVLFVLWGLLDSRKLHAKRFTVF